GVAYHDPAPNSSGANYRTDTVGVAPSLESGGYGEVLGWTNPGEWLNYTVNVASSGTYGLSFRIASGGPGGTFHVNVDGVNVTGPVHVGNTGGWWTYANISGPNVSLSAGKHVLTLAIDSANVAGWGVGDFEKMTLTSQAVTPPPPQSAPFGGLPQGVPGTIEFENYDTGGEGVAYHDAQPNSSGGNYRSDTIGLGPSQDADGGEVLGWINPGEWLNYTVNVASSTTYTVTFRVASGGPGGTFHLNVDGVNATGPVHLGNTGGWWTYTNISVPNVSIPAGKHVLTLVIDSANAAGWGVGDFNWMQITDNPATSPRTQWWRDAKYGMFIHWGLYSQLAGHWNGQTTSGLGEWIMNDLNIPLDQYAQVANQFDPTQFSAQQWVQVAKDAGMNYIVMTAKHHDGFSMFNTSVNTYNVVDATPWHQDPIALMSQAAHAAGLHFGVYYSILNWADPNASAAGIDKYMVTMKTQLKELITTDHPDILWFDGDWPTCWNYERGRELTEYIRNLDPSIMINDRLEQRAPMAEDFTTPEQMIPTNEPAGRLWETCMTLNDTWGYKDTDNDWKSAGTIEQDLSQIVHAGGNYLLNVGPTGQGVIPSPAVQILDQVGSWIRSKGGLSGV
ncbi:MAG TPA: alpha-L-fucosidase, partial [Tepidisphaeraceae bacterium]|nr:alpha-L-fucosidase [Tepidisphaeraceae bacterium]